MALTARSRPALGAGPVVPARTPFRLAARLREWLAAGWRQLAADRVLPAGLRARLAFQPGERVLLVGRAPDGGCAVVATDRALYQSHGSSPASRLGWEQITRVSWDRAAGHLVVTGLTGTGPPRTVVPLRDPGTLVELSQERITHTRLGSPRMLLVGRHRVFVEARRRPGTGELAWIVSCDGDGPDLRAIQVRGQIERAVARLAEELGLTHRSDGDLRLPPR